MAFWITLGRSFFSVALGVALLFWPDKAAPLLGNFIGGFWVAGSLLTVRWGLENERSKLLTILVGAGGGLAGVAMVSRRYVDRWVDGDLFFLFLGIVAILTGILHITGHMQVKRFTTTRRTRSGLLLGLLEIALGLVVVFTPWQERPLVYLVVLGWALVGGVVIFLDALAMRREARDAPENGGSDG